MSIKSIPAEGELVIQTIAMPGDTNANGDIFGGWVLSQMDLGGAIVAKSLSSSGRAATVAIEGMSFINPVKVGDLVACYANIIKRGRTSIQVSLQTWTYNYTTRESKLVTKGIFTYVAIDNSGKPIPLKEDGN
jgi:acyl-CoA thioesterase YciA